MLRLEGYYVNNSARVTCNGNSLSFGRNQKPDFISRDSFTKTQTLQPNNNKLKIFFTGLTRSISKKLYASNADIARLLEKYPKSNGVVGNLPSVWISQFPQNSKAKSVKDIYKTFGDASKILCIDSYEAAKYRYNKSKLELDLKPKLKKAEKIIIEALKKNKIIDDKSDIDLKYIGMGVYGCAYRFSILGEDYVLKVYHSSDERRAAIADYHGPLIEANRSAFIKRIAPESQYAPFFFADLKNNYMVEKYIDTSSDKPLKTIPDDFIGIHYSDGYDEKKKENLINDYIIDYGGIEIVDPVLAKNKNARWVYKTISEKNSGSDRCKLWDKLYDKAINNHIANNKDILLGLIASLKLLSGELQTKRINKLLDNTDNIFKKEVVNNIESVHPDQRLKFFEKIITTANKELINPLFKNIIMLPQDKKESFLTRLFENNKSSVNSDLINEYECLPEKIRVDVADIVSDKANVMVTNLFDNILKLDEEDQIKVFKFIAENANREIKYLLFYDLRKLSKKVQIPVFKALASSVNDKLRSKMQKDIVILSEDNRKAALEFLSELKKAA